MKRRSRSYTLNNTRPIDRFKELIKWGRNNLIRKEVQLAAFGTVLLGWRYGVTSHLSTQTFH